ncbi:hypothetical protein GW17_00010942, partial [Ensete ventricosum]
VTWTTFGLRGGYDVLNSRIAGGLTAGGALHGAESYRRRPVFLKICSCWAAEVLLGQLQDGTARFELLQPPAALAATGVRFFARIGSSLYVFVPAEVLVFFWSSFGLMGENVLKSRRAEGLPATKKVEHYTVQKVKGDGRCMFRALVRFLLLFVYFLYHYDLRMAVKEVICDSETERPQYEEALIAITVDESLKQ